MLDNKKKLRLKLKKASKLYVIIFYLIKHSYKNKSLYLLFNHWLFLAGLLILGSIFKSFNDILDRNKTDLHRFKPNSCNALTNEQLDPRKLLHFQDALSRHRGGKQKDSNGRELFITLLSLRYFLLDL